MYLVAPGGRLEVGQSGPAQHKVPAGPLLPEVALVELEQPACEPHIDVSIDALALCTWLLRQLTDGERVEPTLCAGTALALPLFHAPLIVVPINSPGPTTPIHICMPAAAAAVTRKRSPGPRCIHTL